MPCLRPVVVPPPITGHQSWLWFHHGHFVPSLYYLLCLTSSHTLFSIIASAACHIHCSIWVCHIFGQQIFSAARVCATPQLSFTHCAPFLHTHSYHTTVLPSIILHITLSSLPLIHHSFQQLFLRCHQTCSHTSFHTLFHKQFFTFSLFSTCSFFFYISHTASLLLAHHQAHVIIVFCPTSIHSTRSLFSHIFHTQHPSLTVFATALIVFCTPACSCFAIPAHQHSTLHSSSLLVSCAYAHAIRAAVPSVHRAPIPSIMASPHIMSAQFHTRVQQHRQPHVIATSVFTARFRFHRPRSSRGHDSFSPLYTLWHQSFV